MPAIYNFIETTSGRANRIVDYINSHEFFMGVGQSNPWTSEFGEGINDTNPPIPDGTETTIPGLMAIKRCQFVTPVLSSICGEVNFTSCGELEFQEQSWQLVDLIQTPLSTLELLDIQFLYISANFQSSEIPQSPFRSFGVLLDPTFNNGINPNLLYYLPTAISNPGTLTNLVYSTPTDANPDATKLEVLSRF